MCSGSSIFEIKKFCCCGSLRIGSFIIGYLGLIGNVLHTAGGSAHLHYIQSLNFRYTVIYTEYMAIAIAYHAVLILFHAALVWGIHKSHSEFILPWLVVKGFESLLLVIIVFIATIIYLVSPGMDVGILFLLIAIFIFCSWLEIYSFMCVYSYYFEIKPKTTHDIEEADFPPTYIKSFADDKKLNISEIVFTQNAI